MVPSRPLGWVQATFCLASRVPGVLRGLALGLGRSVPMLFPRLLSPVGSTCVPPLHPVPGVAFLPLRPPLPRWYPRTCPWSCPLPSPSPRWPPWGLLSAWGVLSRCFTSVHLPGGTPAPAPGAAPHRPLPPTGPALVPSGGALGLGRSVPLPFLPLARCPPAPGVVPLPLRLPSLVVPLPLVPFALGSGALTLARHPEGRGSGE